VLFPNHEKLCYAIIMAVVVVLCGGGGGSVES
jgi:hypothetical protein